MSLLLLGVSLALALARGLPLLAQTPPPAAGQPPTTQQPATQQPRTPATAGVSDTMLTGCVRSSRADAGTADQKGNVFTLEVSRTASTPVGAGAPPRSATVSKTVYTLSAPESVGLAKHVNHEVQLTGRMQAPIPSTAAPPSTPAGAQGAKPIPGGGGGHRTFEVTALKMTSASCPKQP